MSSRAHVLRTFDIPRHSLHQCVKVLLRMGASVDTQGQMPPIATYHRNHHSRTVPALPSHPSVYLLADSENRSALKWAQLKSHYDVAKVIEAAFAF
jgi:hypothetical protein